MPRTTGDVIIESATLYFEGPEPNVNFMVAEVELIGATPTGLNYSCLHYYNKVIARVSPWDTSHLSYLWCSLN